MIRIYTKESSFQRQLPTQRSVAEAQLEKRAVFGSTEKNLKWIQVEIYIYIFIIFIIKIYF